MAAPASAPAAIRPIQGSTEVRDGMRGCLSASTSPSAIVESSGARDASPRATPRAGTPRADSAALSGARGSRSRRAEHRAHPRVGAAEPDRAIATGQQREARSRPRARELSALPARGDREADRARRVILPYEEPLLAALDVALERVVAKAEDALVLGALVPHLAHPRAAQIAEPEHADLE